MSEKQVEHSAATHCYACFECGSEATAEHHVVPQSRGGTKTVPLCDSCHGKAHGRSMATRTLTLEAMARKKIKGERVGQVPFGYDLAADGVQLVCNAAEQRVIERMKEMKTAGTSLRKICERLNADGVPTKTRRGEWQHTTVNVILRSA
jgi:hypothetical protein